MRRVRRREIYDRRDPGSRAQKAEALPEDQQGTWSKSKLIKMDSAYCSAVERIPLRMARPGARDPRISLVPPVGNLFAFCDLA